MKRNVPNRTLMSRETFSSTRESVNDFCPIKPRIKHKHPTVQQTDDDHEVIENLVNRYITLSSEIKSIRGILYRRGINPEDYLNKD